MKKIETRHEITVRRVAGTMVLISVAGAYWIHPGFLGLGAFVGLNLVQSTFTGICPLNNILDRIHRNDSRHEATT